MKKEWCVLYKDCFGVRVYGPYTRIGAIRFVNKHGGTMKYLYKCDITKGYVK